MQGLLDQIVQIRFFPLETIDVRAPQAIFS